MTVAWVDVGVALGGSVEGVGLGSADWLEPVVGVVVVVETGACVCGGAKPLLPSSWEVPDDAAVGALMPGPAVSAKATAAVAASRRATEAPRTDMRRHQEE